MARPNSFASLRFMRPLHRAWVAASLMAFGAFLIAGATTDADTANPSVQAVANSPMGTRAVTSRSAPASRVDAQLQRTNLGNVRAVIFTGHILSGDGERTGGSILCAPSDEDDSTYRAAISAAAGGVTVDYFDARVDTPTVALLSTYDCVHTWVNYAYSDDVLFGDNLAAYVDQGGKVVLGVLCMFTQWNHLAGTIMTAGYSPVTSPTGGNHGSVSNYAGDGTSCIHDTVTAYACEFRDELALQGSGLQDGAYLDGEIAHAHRPDFRVIYSNGGGAEWLGGTGDWAKLVANACACGTTGDYDEDGDVDLYDYAHWDDCMTGPEAGPYVAGCEAFDFDVDDDVDLADFAMFTMLFSR